jgi:hypothetical protein
LPHLENLRERIFFDSVRVRLMVAGTSGQHDSKAGTDCAADGQMHQAVALTFKVLEEHGYHLEQAIDRTLLPKTLEDIERIEQSIEEGPVDKDDVRILMMSLMGSAG